jgi:hypothetical protein
MRLDADLLGARGEVDRQQSSVRPTRPSMLPTAPLRRRPRACAGDGWAMAWLPDVKGGLHPVA